MFASQEPSQAPRAKVKYAFLVLCDQNEEVQYPFGLYPRSMFSTSEIPDRWLESILDDSSRLKTLRALKITGESLCLFGKIDDGIYMHKCLITLKKKNIYIFFKA